MSATQRWPPSPRRERGAPAPDAARAARAVRASLAVVLATAARASLASAFHATLSVVLVAAALVREAAPQAIAPPPPIEAFLTQEQRAAIDEVVKKAVKSLSAASAVDRDRAALDLAELGAPAEAALLRELGGSGSSVVRRAGLRALFRNAPSPGAIELAWSWAENPTLAFDRRSFALLELGAPYGLEPERAERAGRLGRIAAAPGPTAEIAAFALVRLRTRGAEPGALRALLGGQVSAKLRGALALVLARTDPESLPAIGELAVRSRAEWLRACAWLALADAARPGMPEALRDVDATGVVLSLCAALACVPRDASAVDALAQRLLAEPRPHVVGGLALALAASGLASADELLSTHASDLALRARAPLLQAAVTSRSARVLAAVHRRAPIDARESAMDFAALAGLRCFALPPGEEIVERDPERLSVLAPVLESARRHLVARTPEGAAEAALALVLHGAPLPAETAELTRPSSATPELARAATEIALILRLAVLLERSSIEPRTVRRVGIALALRRGVDPRAWRDLALHHLATSAIGHEAVPFAELRARDVGDPRDPGPNDLVLPHDEPVPPLDKSGDYYSDLVFWLRTRPFRTTVDQFVGR